MSEHCTDRFILALCWLNPSLACVCLSHTLFLQSCAEVWVQLWETSVSKLWIIAAALRRRHVSEMDVGWCRWPWSTSCCCAPLSCRPWATDPQAAGPQVRRHTQWSTRARTSLHCYMNVLLLFLVLWTRSREQPQIQPMLLTSEHWVNMMNTS